MAAREEGEGAWEPTKISSNEELGICPKKNAPMHLSSRDHQYHMINYNGLIDCRNDTRKLNGRISTKMSESVKKRSVLEQKPVRPVLKTGHTCSWTGALKKSGNYIKQSPKIMMLEPGVRKPPWAFSQEIKYPHRKNRADLFLAGRRKIRRKRENLINDLQISWTLNRRLTTT